MSKASPRYSSLPGRDQGHTLVELLVVVVVLAVLVSAAAGTTAALSRVRSRSLAQAVEASLCAAQLENLWRGYEVTVTVSSRAVVIGSPATKTSVSPYPAAADPAANVPRWQTPEGVVVRFTGAFAAPDSGGTISLGQVAVVVRPESGFAWRRW